MTKKKIPVGVEEFSDFSTEQFYYVDKTLFIEELLENWGKVNLFTRPRRFGKSLNMSMLKAFFEIGGRKELFDGLKISKREALCSQYMGQFPVISITLKSVEGLTYQAACVALQSVIGMEALRFQFLAESPCLSENEKGLYRAMIHVTQAGFDIPEAVLLTSLKTLSGLLEKHYGQKTIILIDEYDVPLDKAYQYGYYDEMVSLIRNLFGNGLKGNSSLQFAVLTGCLRISKESIFTGLNNLKVHGITDVRYDEFFGFTEQDVKELLDYYGLSAHAETMKRWYNGYRFGDVSVYCPWDVINYCDVLRADPGMEPEDYWANTSGNDMVKRFISRSDPQTREELEQLIAGETIVKEINQELTYNELDSSIENLWSVLFTTGYLTMKERLSSKKLRLMIPNQEIRDLYINTVRIWFKEQAEKEPQKLDELSQAFFAGDPQRVQSCLTDYLKQTISIRDTGVAKVRKEHFYHGILLGLLSYPKRFGVRSNEESGDGYCDILVRDETADIGLVIEIKYAENGAFDEACAAALAQIESRNYKEALELDGIEQVLKYGIAFYKKRCRVVLAEHR